MKISESLTREIIKYMMSNLGVVPEPLWGKAGISQKDFYTGQNIKIQYDNNEVREYGIFAGSMPTQEGTITAIAVNIDTENEFVLMLRLENNPIYALKIVLDQKDLGTFILIDSKQSWIKPNMYDRILACASIEKMVDLGFTWSPEKNIMDFLPNLKEFIEN